MNSQHVFRICEFPVQSTTRLQLAAHLLEALARNKKIALFFANTNFIVKCRFILEKKDDPTLLIVNDGIGMDIAAKLVHRSRFLENLNGTDFLPFLFRNTERPLRVFMLGGRPEVLSKAASHVRENLGQDVVGMCDGYSGLQDSYNLIQKINASNAEIVLVALGNPTQEKWILENRPQLNANLLVGVGALFDFWSGEKTRAPLLMRQFRIEWLYRLLLEPRRLFRRYTLDLLVFFRHCFKYR